MLLFVDDLGGILDLLCYNGGHILYDGVLTLMFNVDLGDADITVTNLSTGDIWWDSVSGVGTTAIMLSGDEGYYEVHITTDRGEYSGAFTL